MDFDHVASADRRRDDLGDHAKRRRRAVWTQDQWLGGGFEDAEDLSSQLRKVDGHRGEVDGTETQTLGDSRLRFGRITRIATDDHDARSDQLAQCLRPRCRSVQVGSNVETHLRRQHTIVSTHCGVCSTGAQTRSIGSLEALARIRVKSSLAVTIVAMVPVPSN